MKKWIGKMLCKYGFHDIKAVPMAFFGPPYLCECRRCGIKYTSV